MEEQFLEKMESRFFTLQSCFLVSISIFWFLTRASKCIYFTLIPLFCPTPVHPVFFSMIGLLWHPWKIRKPDIPNLEIIYCSLVPTAFHVSL